MIWRKGIALALGAKDYKFESYYSLGRKILKVLVEIISYFGGVSQRLSVCFASKRLLVRIQSSTNI